MRFLFALAAISVCAAVAPPVWADSISIQAGDHIKLANGPGNSPGGEFIATKQVLSGSTWVNTSTTWATFCLESNETFSYGELLKVKAVSNAAVNGGSGGQDGTNSDSLSNEVAWLYTQFSTGTLVGLNSGGTGTSGSYLSDHADNATYLQKAIWYLEDESLGADNHYVTLAKAAVTDGWTNSAGNVKVLNLEKWNGSAWVKSQDQLVYSAVPEPATLALLGAGIAALGAVRRRRSRGVAA